MRTQTRKFGQDTDLGMNLLPTSVEIQVLAGLRFLASGCFYQVDADILGIDKSSVFTEEQKNENKMKFFKMGGYAYYVLTGFTLGYAHRTRMKIHM